MSDDIRAAHRRTKTVLLSGVALLFTIALIQCRPVADRVTGFASKPAYAECVNRCNETYNNLVRIESDRHTQAVKDCSDAACKAAEDALHDSNMAQLDAAKEACKENCKHQQGGGGSF